MATNPFGLTSDSEYEERRCTFDGKGARCRRLSLVGQSVCAGHTDKERPCVGRQRIFRLDEVHWNTLNEWAKENGLASRSAALRDILNKLLSVVFILFLFSCGSVDGSPIEEAVTATACPNVDPYTAIYCSTDEQSYYPKDGTYVCEWACALHLTTSGHWSATFTLVDDCWGTPAFKRLGDCT